MPVQVHDALLRKRFFASRLSCAYCVWLLSAVAIVLVPFLIAFGAGSFWLKEKLYHEQPDVTFRNELVLLVEGTSATTGPFQLMWTSEAAANELIAADALRAPIVRTASTDANRDGRTDAVTVDVSLPVLAGERVSSATLLAFFDFKMHEPAKLMMDAVVAATASGALPAAGASVVADIAFRQRAPLLVKGGYLAPYVDAPLFDAAAAASVADVTVPAILRRAADRNYTAELRSPVVSWDADVAGVATTFDLHVDLRVPPSLAYATPAASEIFKHGWVQYVAVLAFVWALVRVLRDFLFDQRLVGAHVLSDANARKRL
uniref:Transmembrane protein 231 n=1 Tax=Bicosoecida sp. CB-2014 TaxID=1486930 RepID=A0A7S1G4P2_9STRA|mmetsp:Transcript_1134/g.3625  ORF Transcript_1134/g.3625 Transcript_1134/m.3625 type:complete len:318 (+) Transcript_1134:202-1155(+)